MKLYNSVGPNPHVVRMFLAEKALDIPRTEVDLMGGENRQADYVARVNPSGQLPALELVDGTMISEITAICEYIEELQPTPALIGTTPEERAQTRMWTRKIDLNIIEPLTQGFRYAEGLDLFKDRFRCLPEAADGLKAKAADGLVWLNDQMAGRPFVVGQRFTLADIMLFAFLKFGTRVGQPLDPANTHVAGWMDRVAARPSADA